jgi:hypothetical protein
MKDKSWKEKLERAHRVEKEILKWIHQNVGKKAKIVENYYPEYDIECEELGNVEVKEDRMAHQTGNYAIEYENHNGKPSGIAVTTARMFVLVDWEYVTFIPTESLKFLVKGSDAKKDVKMGYERGTKGWLIPRETILNSPFADVKKRWFPIYR